MCATGSIRWKVFVAKQNQVFQPLSEKFPGSGRKLSDCRAICGKGLLKPI